MTVGPVCAAAGLGSNIVEWFLIASLAAACGAGSGSQRMWLLVVLGLAGLIRLAGRFFESHTVSTAATLIFILLAALAALKAFRFALDGGDIDAEHICAALSVYLLAGHFFGFAYWRLEGTWPSTFIMDSRAQAAGELDLPAAIYFSFITLATVGYGDLVPSTPLARALVVSEAVLGQFYMVVMVARLVSLWRTEGKVKEL
jgi:voltage-gated potassium channel Kch